MANAWLRLWHDMPNDPKWRTIARASGQSIALVQAIYLQLLVSASQNESQESRDDCDVTCRHVTVTNEDIAASLDVTESDVDSVTEAMQGRVLDGRKITGWDKRQNVSGKQKGEKKSALSDAERAKRYRDKKKAELKKSRHDTENHVTSRDVTGVTPQIRKEEIREEVKEDPPLSPPGGKSSGNKFDPLSVGLPDWLPESLWREWVGYRKSLRKPIKTPQGANGAVNALAEFRQQGFPPEAVIRHSIANEYQGLFPPSNGATQRRNINAISPVDETIPEGFRGNNPHRDET